MKRAMILAVLIILVSLGAKAQVVVVRPAVPVMVKPACPAAGYVWVAGSWQWNRKMRNYRWVEGYWVKPRRHGAVWVEGHWRTARGGWRYIPGHWS